MFARGAFFPIVPKQNKIQREKSGKGKSQRKHTTIPKTQLMMSLFPGSYLVTHPEPLIPWRATTAQIQRLSSGYRRSALSTKNRHWSRSNMIQVNSQKALKSIVSKEVRLQGRGVVFVVQDVGKNKQVPERALCQMRLNIPAHHSWMSTITFRLRCNKWKPLSPRGFCKPAVNLGLCTGSKSWVPVKYLLGETHKSHLQFLLYLLNATTLHGKMSRVILLSPLISSKSFLLKFLPSYIVKPIWTYWKCLS